MTPNERLGAIMAAPSGSVGVFNIMRGCWDVQVDAIVVGVALVALAVVIYLWTAHSSR